MQRREQAEMGALGQVQERLTAKHPLVSRTFNL